MQTIPLIFIMVVLPQMFRFLEPASVVCNRDSNSKTSTEGCYVECCPNDNYDEYVAERDEEHKEDYEDNEGRISKYEPMKKCTTNFTEVEYYTKGYVENGEKWHKKDKNYCNCPEYIKPGRYRDKKANERHRVCKGYLKLEGDVTRDPGSMWLVALFIPMVIGSFCLIFYVASSFKTRMESQLKEIFSPWAQRGIYISYFPKRKHSQGAIYFHINNQMIQGQQMVVMQNGQQVVQILQPPHQQQQQPIITTNYYANNNGQQQPMMAQGTVMQAPNQQHGKVIMQQQQQQPIVRAMAQPMVVNNNSSFSNGQIVQPMTIIQPIHQTQQLQPTLVNQTSAGMQQNNNVVHRI